MTMYDRSAVATTCVHCGCRQYHNPAATVRNKTQQIRCDRCGKLFKPRHSGGMFAIPRDRLLASLDRLRRRLCVYYSQSHCDCKYGASDTQCDEQPGCPEISMMIALLDGMTDAEYRRYADEVGLAIIPDADVLGAPT